MFKIVSSLALATALSLPSMAAARPVKLTTQIGNFGGYSAFVVLYVTDPKGAYVGTIWMAGGAPRYYRHLLDWAQLSGGRSSDLNGITGASVGAGRTLTINTDLSDALLNAGYKLHIDVASENFRESPSEIVVPLNSKNFGKPVRGRRFIKSFSMQM